MQESNKPGQRKASFPATMRAVFWSFFGVRKGKDSAHDVANLNPVHVVLAGVLGAAILIVVLIIIVKLVLAKVII
ncbi:hypothetical protein RCH09_000875 [Actimicrobium sp. GrIS 1.19]|jgi:hypothetical protein|uniref:DUF2970 domain-containing protein n=1 Tax=Actimicrobium sp. GrIS 1.19 TaxID=3071708 RepID=UPI002DFF8E13|nr:hypothetical protein [Actimicrobium sp. GrIS 1.19]